jgi:hypothetical protein
VANSKRGVWKLTNERMATSQEIITDVRAETRNSPTDCRLIRSLFHHPCIIICVFSLLRIYLHFMCKHSSCKPTDPIRSMYCIMNAHNKNIFAGLLHLTFTQGYWDGNENIWNSARSHPVNHLHCYGIRAGADQLSSGI